MPLVTSAGVAAAFAFADAAAAIAVQVAIAATLQVLSNIISPAIKGPRLSDLTVTTSTYGQAIPRLLGEEIRMSGNLTWSTGLVEKKHKKGGFLTPKVVTYTYSTSAALTLFERSLAEGPAEGVSKIIANGKTIFDASVATSPPTDVLDGLGRLISRTWTQANGTHSDFDTLTFYAGGFEQDPDPAIEAALGVGNVPAYRGSGYIVITVFQLKNHGNRFPNLECIVQGRAGQTLAEVVDLLCAAAGIDDDHDMSSTQMANQVVRGCTLASTMSCWDALKPLQAAYNFQAAEQDGQIRFMRKAQNIRGTIPLDAMAAHIFGDERPRGLTHLRALETKLAREFSVTYLDPARDYQANTQTERRSEGSADSNVAVELAMALTDDEARAVAGRGLWEIWTGRQTATFNVTDQWGALEAGRVYGVPTTAGTRPMRINRRTRGANGIIEIEAVADESAAYTFDPVGSPAAVPANPVKLPGPVNPPIIFEPPASLTNGEPEVWLAISGGDGTTAAPAWLGCDIYAATADVTGEFELVGSVSAPACMGKLTAALPAYLAANPDAVNTLQVDLAMSGETIASVSAGNAAIGAPTYYVDGEFLSIQDVTPTGGATFDGDTLYRALNGSTAGLHAIGSDFARLDALIFSHHLPAAYVGVTIYYRFVGPNELVANVPSYSFTPVGVGYGGPGSGTGAPIVASEDLPLATGGSGGEPGGYCLVNIWDDAGTTKLRLADCTDQTRPCHGFVTTPVAMAGLGVPNFSGQISGLAGLTAGAELYLGEDGELTAAAPAASGSRVQVVAIATGQTTADVRLQLPSLSNINP